MQHSHPGWTKFRFSYRTDSRWRTGPTRNQLYFCLELDELAHLQKEGVRFAIQKFPALIAGKRTPLRALEE